jgi:uncharacterized protein (TIGR02145 family)
MKNKIKNFFNLNFWQSFAIAVFLLGITSVIGYIKQDWIIGNIFQFKDFFICAFINIVTWQIISGFLFLSNLYFMFKIWKRKKPSVQTLNSPDPPNTFRDPRDKRLYRTVEIGDRIWMAENFDYKGDGTVGRYYNDDPKLGEIYGRLYTWDEAMKNVPIGWSLPTRAEWQVLIHFVGGKEYAGYRLKAREGWNKGENGTDDYDFSALPGGYLNAGENKFSLIGSRAAWWGHSLSRHEKTDIKFIENKGNDCYIADYEDYKINMFSVRYVKNRDKRW